MTREGRIKDCLFLSIGRCRPSSNTNPLKLKAQLEQITISEGNIKRLFKILFQNIYYTNYIEQYYIQQDTVSVNDDIGYSQKKL